MASFTVSAFEIFDLEKVGQGQRVQLSLWYDSMANIEIYRSRVKRLALSLTVADILTFIIFDLKRSMTTSRKKTFAMALVDGAI